MVFEEEFVSIPIITIGLGRIMFDDTIQNVQPITEIVDTPAILPTQVMEPNSSLVAAVAMTPFDSGFDPRQRRHLIRAQLVSQLICVQLVLLD